MLADWADELCSQTAHADYMVGASMALQPKTYGYRMLAVKGKDGSRCFLSKDHAKKPHKGACQHTKDVVKAAGLYLNFAASSKVNYETLSDLITHQENKLEVDGIREIRASKETRDMVNRVSVKKVKRSYTKGILKVDQYGNIKALPIGYMGAECLVDVEVESPRLTVPWFWA